MRYPGWKGVVIKTFRLHVSTKVFQKAEDDSHLCVCDVLLEVAVWPFLVAGDL